MDGFFLREDMHKLPAEKYIKQNQETETIIIRVSPELKKKIKKMADKYGSSINRFCEASIRWYIGELDGQK